MVEQRKQNMKQNQLWLAAIALATTLSANAQSQGGISTQMLEQIKQSYKGTPSDVALRNAISNVDISLLTVNNDNRPMADATFSHKVESKGISNQKSSGRCWLFTGLNVLRAKAIAKYNMGEFHFSHNYSFFYDQLEKANLFLQGMIDTKQMPITDKTVEWLFRNPLSDGGQFTGVSDILMKYGVVPAEVMCETNSSNNTRMMASLIAQKLREYGLELRSSKASSKEIEVRKTEMLGTIYRMLVLNLGEPVQEFTWVRKDAKGNPVATEKHTPQSFYKQYVGEDLKANYVMLMNDPTRPYYKLYEIDYDRHMYDGKNWTYVNLPVEDIKEMGIASIKDSTMMYFSCDVGKFFSRSKGLLDVKNYDYGSLMGTTFGMNKKERIQTFTSGSSHAMTLMAVDIDQSGKPTKWMVENSWGQGPNSGHLIMTDEWFNEYMFRLVVGKKYITDKVREVLKQTPTRLPAWDPMFADEE